MAGKHLQNRRQASWRTMSSHHVCCSWHFELSFGNISILCRTLMNKATWHDNWFCLFFFGFTCRVEWNKERGSLREAERSEEGGVFHMVMSSWHPADNYNERVSVPLTFCPLFLSLSSIMAVSSSSVHLLLLISSLDWLSTRGSAFLMDWDHMTSSGKFLVSLQLYVRTDNQGEKKQDWCKTDLLFRHFVNLSAWSLSNINKCDLGSVHHMVLTLVIASYVRHQLQKALFAQMHVEMFSVEQTPHFPGLACQTG